MIGWYTDYTAMSQIYTVFEVKISWPVKVYFRLCIILSIL